MCHLDRPGKVRGDPFRAAACAHRRRVIAAATPSQLGEAQQKQERLPPALRAHREMLPLKSQTAPERQVWACFSWMLGDLVAAAWRGWRVRGVSAAREALPNAVPPRPAARRLGLDDDRGAGRSRAPRIHLRRSQRPTRQLRSGPHDPVACGVRHLRLG